MPSKRNRSRRSRSRSVTFPRTPPNSGNGKLIRRAAMAVASPRIRLAYNAGRFAYKAYRAYRSRRASRFKASSTVEMGDGHVSKFSSGTKRRKRLAYKVFNKLTPMQIRFHEFSTQVVTPISQQGVNVINTLLDYTKLVDVMTQVAAQKRYDLQLPSAVAVTATQHVFLEYIKSTMWITNSSYATVELDIYDISTRRDTVYSPVDV